MNKVLTINQAIRLSRQFRNENKRIVLAGGCFDIMHIGHVLFLEKAKEKGDILFVWIESDMTIRKKKGENRPIHTQKDRAHVLAALTCVDFVILLPQIKNNQQYDDFVKKLKPAIIAATKGDLEVKHKKRSARAIGAKIAYVTKRIGSNSTSRLAELVAREE